MEATVSPPPKVEQAKFGEVHSAGGSNTVNETCCWVLVPLAAVAAIVKVLLPPTVNVNDPENDI